MMKKVMIFTVGLAALAMAGCQTLDAKIGETATQADRYCTALQAAALAGLLFAGEKQRVVALQAQEAVRTYCASPARNSTEFLFKLAEVYANVRAVGIVPAGAKP